MSPRSSPRRPPARGSALLAGLLGLALLLLPAPARAELPDLDLDLHAHLFMKEGLGWLFRGSFDEPLKAHAWGDRLSSKANADSLDASDLGLVVVALFAHPLYVSDLRLAIRAQIEAAKAFVASHPRWAIARSPAEARALLEGGRRVLVLSLEGAAGVLDSQEDLRAFVEEEGVRIVTELHLVDDRYGGVAMLDGFQYVANPMGVVDQLLGGHHDADGTTVSRHGLSPLGRRLARELIARGMWLDLTHASDASFDELATLSESAGHPLLVTHAQLRRYRATERATSDRALRRIARSGGVIGLLPSEDALVDLEGEAPPCPAGCSAEACAGGAHAFALAFRHAARLLPAEAISLGTDFNGGMRHLRPSCGTRTSLDDAAGLYAMGQTAPLWAALRALGVEVPTRRQRLEAFLAAWERVTAQRLPDEGDLPRLPHARSTRGPSLATTLGLGFSTGDTEGAALLASLGLRLRKDHGDDVGGGEPIFHYLRAQGEVAKSIASEQLGYASLQLEGFGVLAEDLDRRLRASAGYLQLRRQEALEQSLRLRLGLLGAEARLMPDALHAPGIADAYLGLGANLLGYERIEHPTRGPDEGLWLGEARIDLGISFYPEKTTVVALRGTALSDYSLLLRGSQLGHQTDIMLAAGIELAHDRRRLLEFIEARWYLSGQTATSARIPALGWLDAPHLRIGVATQF
ncbi:MAG: membrane dipeptidase [Polyangiaceae bacterium]